MSGLRFPGPCDGRPVPVLTFHGLADPQNPYDGHAAGRGAEWVESVPDALAGWARHNAARATSILEDPPGPLSTMRYDGCANARGPHDPHRWPRPHLDEGPKSIRPAVMWQFIQHCNFLAEGNNSDGSLTRAGRRR